MQMSAGMNSFSLCTSEKFLCCLLVLEHIFPDFRILYWDFCLLVFRKSHSTVFWLFLFPTTSGLSFLCSFIYTVSFHSMGISKIFYYDVPWVLFFMFFLTQVSSFFFLFLCLFTFPSSFSSFLIYLLCLYLTCLIYPLTNSWTYGIPL